MKGEKNMMKRTRVEKGCTEMMNEMLEGGGEKNTVMKGWGRGHAEMMDENVR